MTSLFKGNSERRRGLTLVELIVVIFILLILLALLMPAVRTAREPARRVQCMTNLRLIGLALHNYHHTHNVFPSAMGGTGVGPTDNDGNANRLSGLVALTPFLEASDFFETISSEQTFAGQTYPPMGPAPWVKEYPPWHTPTPQFWCPSDRSRQSADHVPATNYAFCIGDIAREIHAPAQTRGMFAPGRTTTIDELTDGLANTIAMSEIAVKREREVIGQIAIEQPAGFLTKPWGCYGTLEDSHRAQYRASVPLSTAGRGANWIDGSASNSLFNTILPPNGPSCAVGDAIATDGIYSAGSDHNDGVNVLMADGRVRFVSESIDRGPEDASVAVTGNDDPENVPSPFGVWGALGSRSGGEQMEDF